MSTKKSGRSTKNYAEKVAALRKFLGLNLAEFADKLNTTHAAPSYWENGKSSPSKESYVLLGNLGMQNGFPEAQWFWKEAGLDIESFVRTYAPQLERVIDERLSIADIKQATVPLLSDVSYVQSPLTAPKEAVEFFFPLPAELVPSPKTTSAVFVKNHDMKLFGDQDIVVLLDSSETDFSKLQSKLVLALYSPRSKAKSSLPDSILPELESGLHLRYLNTVSQRGSITTVLTNCSFEQIATATQMEVHIPISKRQELVTDVARLMNVVVPIQKGEKRDLSWKVLGRVTCCIASEHLSWIRQNSVIK